MRKLLAIGYLIDTAIWLGASIYFTHKLKKKVKGKFNKCQKRKVKIVKAEWTVV